MKRLATLTVLFLLASLLSTGPVLAGGTTGSCGQPTPSWVQDNCYDGDCTNVQECLSCVHQNYTETCIPSCIASFAPSRWDQCPDVCRDTMIRGVSDCIDEFSGPPTTTSGYSIDERCWTQTTTVADCQQCVYEVSTQAEDICDAASPGHEICDALTGFENTVVSSTAYEEYCQYVHNGGPNPTWTLP